MILRNAAWLLILFLYLTPANAMEEEKDTVSSAKTLSINDENWKLISGDSPAVIVHIWKNPGGTPDDEHIAIQTPTSYMSFRQSFDFFPLCYAAPTYEIDQRMQDGKRGHSGSWPCDTFTLRLDPKPIDEMWKTLLIDSRTFHFTFGPAKTFKGVNYVENMLPNKPLLIFTNITMGYGLLGQGKMYVEDVYSIRNPKYFKNDIRTESHPYKRAIFDNTILYNSEVNKSNPSFEEFSAELQYALKRHELVKIHKDIENKCYGLDSISSDHQTEIIKMLNTDETIEKKRENIQSYLRELGERKRGQQSYLSPMGWANTFGYGEWK